MTHNDYEHIHKIQNHWRKEQQLIRQKYQIPYSMTYKTKQCSTKSISIPSRAESLFKRNKINTTHNDMKDKNCDIPPMYCSKCHLDFTECLCQNGLGQWWVYLQKSGICLLTLNQFLHLLFIDNLSKTFLMNSIHDRHVSFDTNLIDLSSIERTNSQILKSKFTKHQYVLLDWNNRQSLLNFLNQTTKSTKNLSNMTVEQLHKQITNNNHIHIFNSIIDLTLTMNKEQHHTSLCHIYIDPYYYSTIQDTIPLSQSQLIADNTNINRALYSIEKLAVLLGVKIDQTIIYEKITTKQRKSILNQQLLFLASKIPYNTFRNTSIQI